MTYQKFYIMGCATLLLSGAAQADEQKAYNLTGFTGIKASAGINVTFEQSEDYSITAEFKGDTNEDNVKIRLDGDLLKISFANTNGQKNLKAKIAVTGPKLYFAQATSGANLNIESVTTGDMGLHASSGGSLSISGQCQHVKSRVSSGGSIKAKKLKCQSANVKASSGGSSKVYATDYGKGHSSSGGSINIYGKPVEQKKNKSWSGGTVRFP